MQKVLTRDKSQSCLKTAASTLQVDTLPNIKILLQILATLPVTTAEPYRTFNRLQRTATAIRSMDAADENQHESLFLLPTHLDLTPNTDDFLDRFAYAGCLELTL